MWGTSLAPLTRVGGRGEATHQRPRADSRLEGGSWFQTLAYWKSAAVVHNRKRLGKGWCCNPDKLLRVRVAAEHYCATFRHAKGFEVVVRVGKVEKRKRKKGKGGGMRCRLIPPSGRADKGGTSWALSSVEIDRPSAAKAHCSLLMHILRGRTFEGVAPK